MWYFRLKILILNLMLIFTSTSIWSIPVIFDLNGVLVETNKRAAFGLFWKELLFFTSTFHNPLNTKTRLFEILNLIAPLPAHALPAEDGDGIVIPQLIRYWLSGSMKTRQLKTIITEFCTNHPEIFYNKTENLLILAIANMMFTPERFVKTQTLNNDGLAFAKRCKQQGHSLYILSNWDAESFNVMVKRYPELFELFDGIVISGTAGSYKPETQIYNTLLESYNINPYEAIFIDDQQPNLNAAQELGINTILCTKTRCPYAPWSCKPDFASVQESFDAMVAELTTVFCT